MIPALLSHRHRRVRLRPSSCHNGRLSCGAVAAPLGRCGSALWTLAEPDEAARDQLPEPTVAKLVLRSAGAARDRYGGHGAARRAESVDQQRTQPPVLPCVARPLPDTLARGSSAALHRGGVGSAAAFCDVHNVLRGTCTVSRACPRTCLARCYEKAFFRRRLLGIRVRISGITVFLLEKHVYVFLRNKAINLRHKAGA